MGSTSVSVLSFLIIAIIIIPLSGIEAVASGPGTLNGASAASVAGYLNSGVAGFPAEGPELKFSYTLSSISSRRTFSNLYLDVNEYGYFKAYMYSGNTYHITLVEETGGDHDIYIYRYGVGESLVESHENVGGEDFYFTPSYTDYYYIVDITYGSNGGRFSVSICPSSSGSSGSGGIGTTEEYTLYEAVHYGYVEAYITGTGDYYGESMYIKIVSKVSYNLEIVISQGRILVPKDEYSEYQRMIIAKEEVVYLSGENDYEYLYVYAFCIDPFKEIPESTTYYDVGPMASSSVVRLLQEIEDRDMLDDWNAQLAVWIATNPDEKDEIMDEYVMEVYNELKSEYGTEYAAQAILEEVVEPANDLLKDSHQAVTLDDYEARLNREAHGTTTTNDYYYYRRRESPPPPPISPGMFYAIIIVFIVLIILVAAAIAIYKMAK